MRTKLQINTGYELMIYHNSHTACCMNHLLLTHQQPIILIESTSDKINKSKDRLRIQAYTDKN